MTTALAGIPLFAPLLAGVTIMELDFDAAEQAVDREEGGASRKRSTRLIPLSRP